MDKRIDCDSCPLNGIGTDELCEGYCSDMADFIDEIRADAIEEVEQAMYHQTFNIDHEEDGLQKWDSGNWIRYKLFENVIEQLKEQMQKGAE